MPENINLAIMKGITKEKEFVDVKKYMTNNHTSFVICLFLNFENRTIEQ